MRLTRRQFAMSQLSQAPLDYATAPVPEKQKRTYPEAKIQAACVQYLKIRRKRGDIRYHFSMTEGKRDPKRAGWAVNMGLSDSAGFPDLMVLQQTPEGRKCIFIEIKAPGGKLQDNQIEWRDWLQNKGWEWHLIYSVTELKAIVP